MGDPPEIEGAVPHWMSFVQYNACLTAEHEGQPCGMAIVFLQAYQKLKHKGILVRYFDKPGLHDKIRITIGRVEENNALLGGIRSLAPSEKAA